MALDPVKRRLEPVDEHGAEHERHAQPQRVGQQHRHAHQHMPLLGRQRQCRAEERPDAGRPPQREHDAEQHRRAKAHLGVDRAAAAAEQRELDDAEVAKAEEDDHRAADDVDGRVVLLQQLPGGAGQRAHKHKDDGEPGHKAQRAGQRFAGAAFAPARKVAEVNRQHRQQAGREEGDDPLQKSDEILHGTLLYGFSFVRFCLSIPGAMPFCR